MSKTKVLEPEIQAVNGVAYGFRPAPTTRTVRADPKTHPRLTPSVGAEPFTAEIRDDLTIAEQKAIPTTGDWTPILQRIAPWIYSWNATGKNVETGEDEPLPPPAEAGWEIMESVSPHVLAFLVYCFKLNIGGDLPKGRNSSNDTGDGAVAAN